MHGSQSEIVVNTLDHYSHLKDIKSNPCWHFKMLPLGFRGNIPEQFSLSKAIIFYCKRAELCQFTPCSNLKEIQKRCCCRAWGWHTATLQPNSHWGITSANDPRETGHGRGTGLYPSQRFPGWKTPCDIPAESCLGSYQALQHLLPHRGGTQALWLWWGTLGTQLRAGVVTLH